MPNDQFGKPISVGDTVTLVGEVTKVFEDPNFINCTVKLQKPMPPAGTETSIQVNTVQLEKKGGDGGSKAGGQAKSQAQEKPPAQEKPHPAQQPPQPSHGAPGKK